MRVFCLILGLLTVATAAPAQTIEYGDNSSQWANDGECDDRRFFGQGMATSLDWQNLGRDADDCRSAYEAGRIKLWVFAEAVAATRCSAIDFGDDSGQWADDGDCDDPRFEGITVDDIVVPDDRGRDASDCRRACDFGLIGLRDY